LASLETRYSVRQHGLDGLDFFEGSLNQRQNDSTPDAFRFSFISSPCLESALKEAKVWNRVWIMRYIFETAKTIERQRSIVRGMQDGYKSSLMDTLVRFRCTDATAVRDKIYGLLGLFPEPHGITADYQKSPQQLFSDFTIALINTFATLDIICQNYWYTGDRSSIMPGLPTWATDFTQRTSSIDLYSSFLFAQ
jgi:hypothetical protein